MLGIFLRFLKDKKNMIIGFSLGALAFIEMYVALFPSIQSQAVDLEKMMAAFPQGFMEAFGMNSTQSMFSQLETYMSTEYFSFFWPILITIMSVSFANAICVTEIEKGTIELTLAQPVSRFKILLSKYLVGVLAISVFTLTSTYGIMLSASLHNIDYLAPNYLTTSLVGILCGVAIFSIATFFSVLFSERGRATVAMTSIILIMYTFKIISSLKDSLVNFKYFSFFYYFDAPVVFGKNEIIEWSLLVFLGTILTFSLLSIWRFQKRDIAV